MAKGQLIKSCPSLVGLSLGQLDVVFVMRSLPMSHQSLNGRASCVTADGGGSLNLVAWLRGFSGNVQFLFRVFFLVEIGLKCQKRGEIVPVQ